MKDATIKVGTRDGARKQVEVRVSEPETLLDVLALCANNEVEAVKLAKRGLDIWRQDRILRQMFAEGATVEEMEKAVKAAKVGATKGRGRPTKAKTVVLPKTRDGRLDAATVMAILAKAGINTIIPKALPDAPIVSEEGGDEYDGDFDEDRNDK